VEKNFTSSSDREENLSVLDEVKPKRSLGATILRVRLTLFWSRHESKRVTGTAYYSWTSCRIQEAGKTTDALA